MKKTVSVLLVFILSLLLCFNSYAAAFRVFDNAEYMTAEESDELEEYLSSLREKDKFDIVIVTEHYVDDLETYADDFYDINGYGYGEDNDGLLLLVTDDGAWLSTCGFGIDAIDPYLSELSADFHINTDEAGYFYAFTQFADSVSECVTFEREAQENDFYEDYDDGDFGGGITPGDYDDDFTFNFDDYNFGNKRKTFDFSQITIISAVSLGIGLVAAFIIVASMKAKHRSVAMKKDANYFIVGGSFVLSDKRDYLVSRHVTKTPIPKDDSPNMHNSGSSGGGFSGGGTHVSSSGVTHGGGAF